ncbi:hypothetical protein HDV05_002411 [Chytridiales sp. JEL 0842]|nr:hypothetical protein HDV05_002411 [Chytridiales sp. JEL 0842]
MPGFVSLPMVAYGEFRTAYEKDQVDQRMVFYGIRYIIENYINVKWTREEVDEAVDFFKTHNASLNPNDPSTSVYPFPADLFYQFIKENGGYFPVKIQALPEGSVVYPHTPVFQIIAEGKYSRLVTYLETILTMIWYPSAVASLSRRCKDLISEAYKQTVDDASSFTLNSRLHDFGFRGCTSVEQSVIGGCAHLLNFEGTDTLSAAYYAQYKLNGKKPVATSIPATEHSVMTAHPDEKLLDQFGSGFCACVMDSYDYVHALEAVLPTIASLKVKKGGFLVLRPDSGDPVEVVLQGLRAADKVFGSTVNSKGFKVLKNVGIIQGDGINHVMLKKILDAVVKAGYAAQNVAYGMGGGLLQKVNRDTMSFATKLSQITYANGTARDVMKRPKTDAGKISLPGELTVVKDPKTAVPTVHPHGDSAIDARNALVTVYDNGKPVFWKWESFDNVRKRLESEWASTAAFKKVEVVSAELRKKINNFSAPNHL